MPVPKKVSSTGVAILPPSGNKAVVLKESGTKAVVNAEETVAQALLPGGKAKTLNFDPEKTTPKNAISNWYRHHHDIKAASKSNFTVTVYADDEGKWFAATFTCPVTGYTVDGGTLRDTNKLKVPPIKVVDGRRYNKGEGLAIHAASGRMMDAIQLLATGNTEPRYCEEEPILLVNELLSRQGQDEKYASRMQEQMQLSKSPKTSLNNLYQNAVSSKDIHGSPETQDMEEVSLVMTSSSGFNFAIQDSVKTGAAPVTFQPEEDTSLHYHEADSDEEFTIQNLSGLRSTGTSTLERVMEAWGESVVATQSSSKASDASWNGVPMYASPRQHKERVIADTIEWCNRMKLQGKGKTYSVFQTTTLPVTVQSAHAALRALAKSHRSVLSKNQQTNQRVEAAAKEMVDFMNTADSTNVEVYNSYLKCLSRSSAEETAKAAEDILRAMIERRELDGRLLPEPNIQTFNGVIQLWAVTGGNTGLEKCQEIFDMIKQERDKGMNVQPNRDTFLSLLSSLAWPSSHNDASAFDRERAQEWIEQMRALGNENHDDTLKPDTQVFNAPLRWSGGMRSARSRPFTQGMAWDKYDDIFRDGFRPLQEDDPLRIEARRIEEWLLEMETIGPAPDAETFEAAIQAWVRSGTADGLRRAELVALRAIASDKARARVQTFHPIIAALALSGDERAPQKVQEWIERLEERSTTFPEMKPDARIRTCLFLAKRMLQRRLLATIKEEYAGSQDVQNENIDQKGDDVAVTASADTVEQNFDAIAKATEIASACADDLSRMCDDLLLERTGSANKDGFVMEPAIFSHVYSAWGDVAIAKAKATNDNVLDAIKTELQAMNQTVRQFDAVVQLLRSKHVANDTRLDAQLLQFLYHAQTVNLGALSYLNEIDRQRDAVESSMNQNATEAESSLFHEYLYEAESILRRAEELRNVFYIHSSADANEAILAPEDRNLVYDDLFTYSCDVSDASSDKSYIEKQIALYSEIVDGCRQMKSSPDNTSECVRLCMMIIDFLDAYAVPAAAQTVDCTDLFLGILTVVENVPNSFERYEVLRRVFYSVKSISEVAKRERGTLTVDMQSVMEQMKSGEGELAAMGESSNRKKPVRARRIVKKRQRWRTAG